MNIQAAPVLLTLFLAEIALSAPPQYSIVDLTIHGRSSAAAVVNDLGAAVFYAFPTPDGQGGVAEPGVAYLADANGLTPLPGIGAPDGYFIDMSNAGVVVSNSKDLVSNKHIAVRYAGGVVAPLGIFANASTFATGVNESGQVVGGVTENGVTTAYLYGSDSSVQLLGSLEGLGSFANDVNEQGAVVGVSYKTTTQQELEMGFSASEAFLWQGSVMTGLGTLGGGMSEAVAINDGGSVVGYSRNAEGKSRAFQFDASIGIRELVMPGVESWAKDINNSGVVVGAAQIETLELRAVIYDPLLGGRLLQDLIPENSGWQSLIFAESINSKGQIFGNGIINGEHHLFLATPTVVPEPMSCTVGLIAACSLIRFLRRRPAGRHWRVASEKCRKSVPWGRRASG